ncbi:hypothetical protein SAMN05421774_1237 [Gemmobacter megaterium]|uniref:Uncharacterized protein n=1 Tax=Gemmobacter megaterium TaxID=1086013 RepID=A0A1N7QRL6_9RHOB|nr:hypothetical protein [Gemmobacter megaterium]GGE29075.1 hypothetical protein GCM10011345_38940 [Gemmobacter megaterium]SIT25523.1 hypothetical protein SAMN05421774_1237 [Gemmobacter megaterium]
MRLARIVPALASLMVLAAGPAIAQDDPMETQRCVWRCLANSPGAASAQYQACVARLCSEPAERSAWASGRTADGRGAWAGFRDPVTGYQLSWVCTPGRGPSGLVLGGPAGPAATLVIRVDGMIFTADFAGANGAFHAGFAADAPLITALVRGHHAELENSAGQVLMRLPLMGAGRAIGQAQAACR